MSPPVLLRRALPLLFPLVATVPSTWNASAAPPTQRPGGTPSVGGLQVLAGSLHDHSTLSDGHRDAGVVADWLLRHRTELGVDFADFTEHSDLFPTAYQNTSVNPWTQVGAVAAAHTVPGFSLLRGFEWTNDQQNHINVIGSANWTSRFETGEASLSMLPFWQWLATTPTPDPAGLGQGLGGADGVGQFNHLGDKGALNWDDYAYNAAAAQVMSTIELRGDEGRYGLSNSDAGWYWFALAKGWTVSPVMDFDWHNWENQVNTDGTDAAPDPGASCGVTPYMNCQRSLVLAGADTPAAILDALHHRRTTASERPSLWATLRGPGGEWQGSSVAGPAGGRLTLTVDAGSADPLTSVDIVSDSGTLSYFYGDNPQADWGGSQLTPSYIEQHRRWLASGGQTTLKHQLHANGTETRFDQPPPGSVVASVPLSGTRATAQVTVTVPATPSSRPDGKHFYYAVVHSRTPDPKGALDARAWTGPILSAAAVAGPPATAGSSAPGAGSAAGTQGATPNTSMASPPDLRADLAVAGLASLGIAAGVIRRTRRRPRR